MSKIGFDVRLAVDIGTHAGQEAAKKILEICENLDNNPEKCIAAIVAFNVLKIKLEQIKAVNPLLKSIAEMVDLDKFMAQREKTSDGPGSS